MTFQSNKLGIYQAAQNMSITHFNAVCVHLPRTVSKFNSSPSWPFRQRNENGVGRPDWAKSATQIWFARQYQ
jgi:hypothetical protein